MENKLKKNPDLLSSSIMNNFISEQANRFKLVHGKKCHTGLMFFCGSYLEACALYEIVDARAMYLDTSDNSFAVIAKGKL